MALPPGYTLEESSSDLPQGYTLDPVAQAKPSFGSLILKEAKSSIPGQVMGALGEAAYNAPKSIYNLGADTLQAITSPIQTAKGVGAVLGGVFQNVRNLSPEEQRGSAPAFDTSAAEAAGEHFAGRYGSLANALKTFKTDPAGFLSDVTLPLTAGGSGLATLPGRVGRAGQMMSETGRALDPFTLTAKGMAAPFRAAEPVVSNTIGFTTGAGSESLRNAARAGMTGGEAADAFLAQMRRSEPVNAVVDQAKNALETMRNERSASYNAGMGGVLTDPKVLGFAPIDAAVQNIKNAGMYKGQVINQSAADTWGAINQAIDNWKVLDPLQFHTPAGLDALKKQIYDIGSGLPGYGTPSHKVVGDVYNAIKDQIVKQAPQYGVVMRDYENASNILREMEKTLSLNPKANVDTTVRKLQSVLRNNANTNYGRREELANILSSKGSGTLMPSLAGQALSSATPRSMQGIVSAGGMGITGLVNPGVLAGLATTSPRLMGETAYYGGKAAGLADALGNYVSKAGDPRIAANIAYQLQQLQENKQ